MYRSRHGSFAQACAHVTKAFSVFVSVQTKTPSQLKNFVSASPHIATYQADFFTWGRGFSEGLCQPRSPLRKRKATAETESEFVLGSFMKKTVPLSGADRIQQQRFTPVGILELTVTMSHHRRCALSLLTGIPRCRTRNAMILILSVMFCGQIGLFVRRDYSIRIERVRRYSDCWCGDENVSENF